MNWYNSLSRAKQIVIGVLSLHVLICVMLAADHWSKSRHSHQRKIAVRTIRYTQPAPTTVASAPPATAAKAIAKTTPTKPAAAKKVAKAPTAKKSDSIQPVSKKAAATTAFKEKPQEDLAAQLQNSINEIAAPHSEPLMKSEISVPTLRQVFHFSSEESDLQPTDAERIASLLEEILQLPDFGDVKAQLKIDRMGKLESLKILESKSSKNSEFLKKRLPEVEFPCLNETASITIVFRNAN